MEKELERSQARKEGGGGHSNVTCVKSSKCFVNTAKSSNILVSGLKKKIVVLNEVF